MSPSEFESRFDLSVYRRLRSELGADGAFLPIERKVCTYDASKPVLGKIPLWRLEREGLARPVMAGLGTLAALSVAGAVVGVLAYRHENGLSGVWSDAKEGASSAASSVYEAVSGLWASLGRSSAES